MAEQRHLAVTTVAVLIALGLFVFLLYVYIFVPLSGVVQALRQVNPIYFALALATLFMSTVFYSLTWQRLLHLLSVNAHFFKVFQFSWIESFVNLTVPAEPISGDMSRIYLMSRESSGDAGKVTASVIGHRILTTSVTVGSLIASTVFFVFRYTHPLLVVGLVTATVVGGIVYVTFLFYLSTRRQVAERFLDWVIRLIARVSRGRWRPEQLKDSTVKMLIEFHEGILTLGGHPRDLIQPLFFSVLAWLLDLATAVIVFLSLGSLGNTISLSAIVISYSVGVAIQYIPVGVIPGEVGLVEIVMTSLFAVLGNPQAIAVFAVATVLIRIITFWIRLLVGGLTVQLLGIKSIISAGS